MVLFSNKYIKPSNYRSSCRITIKTIERSHKSTGLVTNCLCTVQFVTALLFFTFLSFLRRFKNEIS